MWQAFWALLGAAATVAACYAAGALLVDWARAPLKRVERFPLAFVVGASVLHLVVFAVFAASLLGWARALGESGTTSGGNITARS